MNYENLVSEKLNLVHACAHRMENRGIEYDDLYSAGCIGLVKAAKRFDTEKGFKFSTYAVHIIFGEMKQLFRDNNPIKLSRSVKELGNKANKAIFELKKLSDKEPTVNDIAKYIGISAEEVTYALNAVKSIKSLDSDDGIEKKAFISIEDKLIDRVSVNQVLDRLDTKDKILIKLRFYSDKTQSETARIMGLTQVQVSRKEKSLLKQLKNTLSV